MVTLTPDTQAKNFNSNKYTGEQLFEGIFFGMGTIGKQFPEVWEQTEFKNLKISKEDIKIIQNL
ncbi:TPA: hypothetical protein OXJ23_002853, partial [Staphylococcus aureus]|nr:hypothetical protein [Staphylococcus aureus]